MPKTLKELREENPGYTMDLDNIYMIYASDEEVAFNATATKISEHLASYFGQDVRLYADFNTTKINSDTDQRGMKIKEIMYDIIVQCLDQEELDRIEVLEIINGPWYTIPEDPGYIPVPPDPPELPYDPTIPEEGE